MQPGSLNIMSDRKHYFERFWDLTPEEVKAARTITIRLKDGTEAEVDDERNWFADDPAVFDKVVPVADNWPNDDYYPLPLLRAHALATWVIEQMGGEVVTPKPDYKPEDYEVPPGTVA